MIKKILFALAIISSTILTAQRNNSSPYSFFGVGEEFSSRTVEQSSMGGIGTAFSSERYLNFINPAANADLRYATYGIGGLVSDLTLNSSSTSESGTFTNLSYIVLGIPISKKAGFTAGLQPQTSLGYSLLNQVFDADDEITEFTRFSGSGGTSKIFGGLGYKVLEDLSIGVEAAFVFGTLENNIFNQRANVTLATKNEQTVRVRGGIYKAGLQYKKKLKDDLQVNAGAVFQLSTDLSTEAEEYLYSLTIGGTGNEIPRDTISSSVLDGKFSMPLKSTFGLGIGKKDKWYAGINYEFQDALDNSLNPNNSSYMYGGSNKIALGGFYLPKINSISSYFDRITYRAGFRFEDTGLVIDGSGLGNNFTSIKDFGINVGLGLPLGNRISNINVGLEYGQRGTTDNDLIKENYFNFRLSLSLNDIWFRKREID